MVDLIAPLIWLAFVAVALRPPVRRGAPGFVVFLVSMAVNEIPLVLMLVFVVSNLPLFGDPPRSASVAVAVYVLSALVVAGFVRLQVRARTAGPALVTALDAELGTRGRPLLTPWWPGILLPFQRSAAGVRRTRNISYGPDGRANLLDLYQPAAPRVDAEPLRPVLVHLHGGGFTQGAKSRESVAVLNLLASHGWVCLSANYRLRAAGAFPNSVVDTKRVVAWVRTHAGELAADPAAVLLAGSSAGAHLAVSAALTANDPRFQPGFEDAETSVAGAVSLYGYLGARTSDPASSPAELARRDAPPLLVIDGAYDTALPQHVAAQVAQTLRAASDSPVCYARLPYTQHNFDLFASVRARVVAQGVERFLDWARIGA